MRHEDEEDPKKPQPVEVGRKGDNAPEADEHAPHEVGPDGTGRDGHHHHFHVRC